MEQLLLTIHVLVAIGLIILVLLQQGKGSEVGASFGSGASQTFFGSQGSGNFLTRFTAILVTIFFLTSLGLGWLATHQTKPKSLDEFLQSQQILEAPVAPEASSKASVPQTPAASVEKQSNTKHPKDSSMQLKQKENNERNTQADEIPSVPR